MSKILLSIVIPTCNRLDTLPRALNSIAYQQLSDIEIVIVDDSKKSLVEKIRLIVSQTVPITIVVKVFRNDGIHSAARARNLGVSQADGEFITFLDDDDMYLPGRLNNMLSFILEHKYIMVSSGRFYETGDFATLTPAIKQQFGELSLKDIQYQNDIDIGFMMARETFLRFNGFDINYKSLEDWDLILRVLEHGTCYKLERMDYAVNLDPNRPRVSDSDSESYLKLAEMYKNKFGKVWYSHMTVRGLRLSGNLSIYLTILNAIRFMTFLPVIEYLRQIKFIIKNILSNFRKG